MGTHLLGVLREAVDTNLEPSHVGKPHRARGAAAELPYLFYRGSLSGSMAALTNHLIRDSWVLMSFSALLTVAKTWI